MDDIILKITAEIVITQEDVDDIIIFDGKPEADVRAVLKKHGFKWAPSQGAWQRMLNPAGKYALNRVKEELEAMQNDN